MPPGPTPASIPSLSPLPFLPQRCELRKDRHQGLGQALLGQGGLGTSSNTMSNNSGSVSAKTGLSCLAGEGWGRGLQMRLCPALECEAWPRAPTCSAGSPQAAIFHGGGKGGAGTCSLSVRLGTVGLAMYQVHSSLSQMLVQPHCWAPLHAASLLLRGPL